MATRSGQANEAGSVHRRGVAAYLAAHGLASRPVAAAAPGPGNPTPVALAFETAHATDDLLCTLSNDSRLFISAKRTCGDDRHLRQTITQWADQVDHLRPGDRLVLATAEPRGIVRDLAPALNRRRDASGTVFPAREQTALDTLRERLAGIPHEKHDRILDAAVVLVVDATEPGNLHHDVASALLEGTVVPAGSGVAALSHLETHLHTRAGSAYTGDLEGWVNQLVDRGVPVYADRRGPAATAINARRIAVAHYRTALAADAGQVDLTVLAEDLEPLVVDDLVEHLQVTVHGSGKDRHPVSLLTLARRRPRLLVEGLPGAGKSAAVTQLAARWAGDRAAPLPILVRLRDLVRSCSAPSDVTLARLCETAAWRAPVNEQPDLVDAMLRTVARGEAVLLLDGLDECLDRRTVVAAGLKQTLAGLPDDTGVLLTTRPSGVTTAGRLALDEVRLTTPRRLDAVLLRLLRHIADVRIPAADRDAWVAERAQRVRSITGAHKDLGSVPLLAVLITLVVADSSDPALPEDTAQVLHRAVVQTVSRWERQRSQLPGAQPGPTDRQLLLGFGAIGHLLSQQAEVTVAGANGAVASIMTTHWGLATAPSAEIADAVRRFWDDHVGVFVAGPEGRVLPRSRVFAEIGAAMHCPTMSPGQLVTWMSAAIADPDRHNALLLAAQLDNRVVDELLQPGDDGDIRGRLAAAAVRAGAALSADQAGRLLNRLTENAATAGTGSPEPTMPADRATSPKRPSAAELINRMDERRLRRDGPVWPWALEIARLPLPNSLENRRAEALAGLRLSDDQHRVARGIAALASADYSDRPLTPHERDDVLGMLAVPLPPEGQLLQSSRRRLVLGQSVGVLEGLGQGTAGAAARLPELDDEAIERIKALAHRAGARDADDIAVAMRAHGHDLELTRLGAETWALIAQATDESRAVSRILLTTIAGLPAEDVRLTAAHRWRLPALCDFLTLLGIGDVTMPDYRAVLHDSEPTCENWLRLMALAADVDLSRLAAQARAALEEEAGTDDPDNREEVFDMASAWPAADDRQLVFGRISTEEHPTVVGLLTARSDWIAESAARLLWDAGVPGLDQQVAGTLSPALPPGRRFLLSVLCCVLSPDLAVRALGFLDTEDPALRWAAATVARDDDDDPQLAALRAQALDDEDATVRVAAGAVSLGQGGVSPPEYWSCRSCGQRNKLSDADCHSCDWGSRPDPRHV